MAQGLKTNLDPLVIGTDFNYPFDVRNEAQTASIDITGFALSWMLKRALTDLDAAAALTLTTGGSTIIINGTYNVDPAVNTQRATVTIADTDTDALNPGVYHWELKRTDAGLESRLAYGSVPLVRGVHRA